jgi:hypothetical protein
LPLDVHVVGEPLVLVAVEYDGNAQRVSCGLPCSPSTRGYMEGLILLERDPSLRFV